MINMLKCGKSLYRVVYFDPNRNVQRTMANNLASYDEAMIHKQYYKHLGYSENDLHIEPFFEQSTC